VAVPDRSPIAHTNNFGALRLLFACLVIVSHSPQIIDGALLREPFIRTFGTITLGALAVDFFFIISGFLIVGSFLSSRSLGSYLLKRVLRIYPAFIVAYLACIFLVGPLVGGQLGALGLVGYFKTFARMLTLDLPRLPGAFSTLPEPSLNSSMWTISYEFRCYLLVPLLAYAGILRRPRLVLGLTAILLLAYVAILGLHWRLSWGALEQIPSSKAILRSPQIMIRFAGLFMAGACFQLYRHKIRFDGRIAAVCAIIATLLLFVPALAEFGLATFGAYALFWTAFTRRLPFLRHVNNDWDISYGVYLYAWPTGALLAYFIGSMTPMVLCLTTLALVVPLAFLSWKVIEEPSLKWKQRRQALRPATSGAESAGLRASAGSAAVAVGHAAAEKQP
jgi:peptidoglycan/LPS O-acetylase OafA/YrhL